MTIPTFKELPPGTLVKFTQNALNAVNWPHGGEIGMVVSSEHANGHRPYDVLVAEQVYMLGTQHILAWYDTISRSWINF